MRKQFSIFNCQFSIIWPIIFLISASLLIATFTYAKLIKPASLINPLIEVEKRPQLTLAVIGDPEGDLNNLKKALIKIKEKGLTTVVLVGDLTQTGLPEQLEAVKQILIQSGLTYYLIPGNHDLWYGRKTCQEKKGINCTNTDTFKEYFGESYSKKIITDHNLLLLDDSDEWLGMGQKQLDWLSQQLNNLTIKQLVFLHIPLYHPESEYAMGYQNKELKKQATEVLEILCQHPPLALFYGHLHHTNQYEYSCTNTQKLKMIDVGSINSERNWQTPRFMVVKISQDNNFELEEVEVGD